MEAIRSNRKKDTEDLQNKKAQFEIGNGTEKTGKCGISCTEESMYDLAELFKSFSDSTRIRILCALADRELCVCDICEELTMTQSAVSHQLQLLRQAKLVKAKRAGKTMIYSLADDHVKSILEVGLEHVEE